MEMGAEMNRLVVWVFAFGLASAVPYGQQNEAGQMPRLTLTLPADVAPEKTMIRYMLSGEFGGHSSFVRTTGNDWKYEIAAGVDGKAAEEIKIVAYMPGCEFETFDEKLPQGEVGETLQCRPVRMTPLRGQIAGISEDRPRVVGVTYVASWANLFFGIYDGMVMTIPLGSVEPDASGAFEIMVPSFTGKAGDGSAQLMFHWSRGKVISQPGVLEVVEKTGIGGSLTARADYPEVVQLVVVTQ